MLNYITAGDAVNVIKSGHRVFIHGGAATPSRLVEAMTGRAPELRDVELVHLHTEGGAPYAQESMADSFRVNAFFVGGNVRAYVQSGHAQYIPVFLSEVPSLFRKGILPLDVALVHVSPPDRHGFCSLGVSVDIARAAVEHALYVVAQVNPNMPRSHGDGLIHYTRFHAAIYTEDPIHEMKIEPLSDTEMAIGKNVAGLIEDGSSLQMGIGGIPNAVLQCLGNHKNLGIHTEMFSDGVIDLVEKGVINGSRKKIHPGKIVSSFAMGSKHLYSFIDDNPEVAMLDVAYVNDTSVIRRNPRVVAINSAIEIDLTGQVCADSIGSRIYSGVGGQMDFIRGASLSEGGKPVIALPSSTTKGISRIVSRLKDGAGVVTTRAHVHYVVTEFGVADLYGKNLYQRARALINISHPDHREILTGEAEMLFGKKW